MVTDRCYHVLGPCELRLQGQNFFAVFEVPQWPFYSKILRSFVQAKRGVKF